jgi:hypothetical protein
MHSCAVGHTGHVIYDWALPAAISPSASLWYHLAQACRCNTLLNRTGSRHVGICCGAMLDALSDKPRNGCVIAGWHALVEVLLTSTLNIPYGGP